MALTTQELVAAAKQNIRQIDTAQAMAELDSVLILDVREPGEYATGCLPGAVNIPRGVLEFKIDEHPAFQGQHDASILVYCLTGGRSALAVDTLRQLGWSRVASLEGGISAWQEAGGTVATPVG